MVLSLSHWKPLAASALALLTIGSLASRVARPQEAAGRSHEFLLEYDESLYYSSVRPYLEQLEREVFWESGRTSSSQLGGREVRRGAIWITETRIVRLAWDESTKTIFVDRNGNGDLSDDEPVEVVGSWDRGPIYEPVVIQAPEGAERGKWNFLLHLERMSGSLFQSAAVVRSGWTGKVELGGTSLRLAVFDDLDGVFTLGTDRLGICPWEEEVRSHVPTFETIPQPERVLIGDVLYDLSLELEAGGDGGSVRATFTESSAPRIDVELLGTHIRSLVLAPAADTPNPTVVFIEYPAGTLRLPEGVYRALIELDAGELGPLRSEVNLVVKPEGENVLRAGCPLDNSVESRRASASGLELSYRLSGVGGEEYNIVNRITPGPRFVARIGDREVASADFRYG